MNKISKKSIAFRIAAGVVGVCIIAVCAMVTMSYTGNPVSKFIAKYQAIKFVDESIQFEDYDLDVTDIQYNRQFKGYDVTFQDKTSQDVRFSVTCDWITGYLNDDYYYMVTQRNSVAERLEDELEEAVRPLIEKTAENSGLEVGDLYIISLQGYFYGNGMEEGHIIPPLNTPYSKELSLEGDYYVSFSSPKDMNAREMADTITDFYNKLTDNGFLMNNMWYEFYMPNDVVRIFTSIYGINDKLADKIERCMNGETFSDMSVISDSMIEKQEQIDKEIDEKLGI